MKVIVATIFWAWDLESFHSASLIVIIHTFLQRNCKKNPHIAPQDMVESSSSPFEKYSRRQRHYSLSRTQSVRETSTTLERPLRALSRQNSFSSLHRTDSFYSRHAMTLGRATYSGCDYAAAVRQTSLFDGYAGFSLYSSIRYVR